MVTIQGTGAADWENVKAWQEGAGCLSGGGWRGSSTNKRRPHAEVLIKEADK